MYGSPKTPQPCRQKPMLFGTTSFSAWLRKRITFWRQPADKSAGIGERGGMIVVHPCGVTTMGVPVVSEPYLVLPIDASDEELGHAVLHALSEAGKKVPHPAQADWGSVSHAFLVASGVASWAEYMPGARRCEVHHRGDAIEFSPTRNDGRGFDAIKDAKTQVPSNSMLQQIGRTAREALGKSE